MKRVVIVGATSGLGYETAKLLIENGCHVGLAGRRTNLLEPLKAIAPARVEIARIDVTTNKAADAGSTESTADVCFVINEEFGLLEGEAGDLLEDLQTLVDFAAECGAQVRLRGEFFSDRGDFCFMSIGLEEGKVQAKYCVF